MGTRAEVFSKAAHFYDEHAVVQKVVASRFAKLLPDHVSSVVELGCGTGLFTHILQQRYKTATITAVDIAPGMIDVCGRKFPSVHCVVADAHTFIAPCQVDLVISCSSFQWFSDYLKVLDNIHGFLSSDGYFAVTMFIEGTLFELAQSYKEVTGSLMPTLPFWTEQNCFERIDVKRFDMKKTAFEDISVSIKNPFDLLKGLQQMGLSRPCFQRPLLPGSLKALMRYYTEHFGNIATYRVFYGLAQKRPLDSRH